MSEKPNYFIFEDGVELNENECYSATISDVKQITNRKGEESLLIIVTLAESESEHSYYAYGKLNKNSSIYQLCKALDLLRRDGKTVDLNALIDESVEVTLYLHNNGTWYVKTITAPQNTENKETLHQKKKKIHPTCRKKPERSPLISEADYDDEDDVEEDDD